MPTSLTLLEKQQLFVRLLGVLFHWVGSVHPEWRLTLGEGYDDDYKGHATNSLHYIRLAQDLNLFVDGSYITGNHPAWHAIGQFWCGLHEDCRWGGNFSSKDYNHVSVTHGGVS